MGAKIRSGAVVGIDGLEVFVEVDVSRGLPGYYLVGLPSAAVRESRQRVLAAVRNSGCKLPLGKVTINLRPADVRKEGTAFDVAIALGIVAAARGTSGRDALFLGELSLFGELRPVRGLLPMVLDAAARGERRVVVPAVQAWEAELVEGIEVIGASTLAEVINWWRGGDLPRPLAAGTRRPGAAGARGNDVAASAWRGMVGQPEAVRAAEIAAAGRHNLLLVGTPGSGKTRLARVISGLQPELTGEGALEVSRIHSAVDRLTESGLSSRRPFRAPHHTVTRAGLIGGGTRLRPGEVTLAHRGVLFLDELGEFGVSVLDVLRQPMEEGVVSIIRGSGFRSYPADFQLVAAMNPCRCGFRGSRRRRCTCSPGVVARYGAKISGPFMDRFDLFVEMNEIDAEILEPTRCSKGAGPGRWSETRKRVASVWKRNRSGAPALFDEEVPGRVVRKLGLVEEACRCLEEARRNLGLSVRGVLRCARVARTIAWLEESEKVKSPHIAEALGFRREALPFSD